MGDLVYPLDEKGTIVALAARILTREWFEAGASWWYTIEGTTTGYCEEDLDPAPAEVN